MRQITLTAEDVEDIDVEEVNTGEVNTGEVNMGEVNTGEVNTEQVNMEQILHDKKILTNLDPDLSSDKSNSNSNSNNQKKQRIKSLSALDDFLPDNDINYHSEDENLITLTDNIKLKDLPLFKKLDYKEVEYKIDKAYFDINHNIAVH